MTACHDVTDSPVALAGSRRVALVGSPNAGKTSVFNHLTGLRAKTGNYPGVTVGRSVGTTTVDGVAIAVEDLPGTYSLDPISPDEQVVTDLLAGKSVWLQRGPVDEAIRASIAIPGVIAPHVIDGRLLADGGILDPLPMAPIAAVNADLTIAVSLSGSEAAGGDPAPEPRPTTEWLNRMLSSTSALLDSPTARAVLDRFGTSSAEDPDDTASVPESEPPRLGGFEVMNRTIDIAQAALARHTLAAYPPDLLIEVPRSACRSLEFHRAAEVIETGRELAAEALDTIT